MPADRVIVTYLRDHAAAKVLCDAGEAALRRDFEHRGDRFTAVALRNGVEVLDADGKFVARRVTCPMTPR